MSLYVAEFFGTMTLILLGNGVVAGVVLKGTKSENAGWVAITLAWGLAVTLSIYAVGRISNAHLNPAITIALWASGDFESNLVFGIHCCAICRGICRCCLGLDSLLAPLENHRRSRLQN